jgi:OmpA-OmpF porin, OOP family
MRMMQWYSKSMLAVTALALSACVGTPKDNRDSPSRLPSTGQQQTRVTDAAIHADLNYIEALQARAAKLNDASQRKPNGANVPVRGYHLAKAQAWLDFALDEYHENDRGPIIENALAQAEVLIGALELDSQQINPDTPIVRGSSKLREDLWTKAANAKQHPNFACAAQKVAQLEVQLVWAGHEYAESGWRHAKPYIQIAEDLSAQIEKLLGGC